MATKTIDVYSYGFEQGTISDGVPTESSTRVRSSAYIPLPASFVGRKLTASATVSTGKTVQVNMVGYVTTSPPDTFDLYWYDSPYTFDLSSYQTTMYFKMCLKYSDYSAITPSEITSCKVTYDDGISFEIGSNGYPVPIAAPDIIEPAMTAPYPAQLWRIDPEWNHGYPFNALLPEIPHLSPPPPGPTGIPTVQPIATTEITDQTSVQWKRYTVGYTNPDLFRFRDGDLPENTKCDVFIKGTNSYRYTEERDHIDGSQTTETP